MSILDRPATATDDVIGTAVVVVHGVIPHPPYGMQDEAAQNLCTQLGDAWTYDVWQPPNIDAEASFKPLRSTTRVHQKIDSVLLPEHDFFDVIEAYWSPLDKGKTSAVNVIFWMLRSIFVPLNTSARYVASFGKKAWDIFYLGTALVFAVVLLVGSIIAAAASLSAILGMEPGSHPKFWPAVWQTLGQMANSDFVSRVVSILGFWTVLLILVAFVGGVLFFQALQALLAVMVDRAKLLKHQRFTSRTVASLALVVVGIAVEVLVSRIPVLPAKPSLASDALIAPQAFLASHANSAAALTNAVIPGQPLGPVVWWLVVSAGAFLLLRTLLQSFFVNFFGDVQIYCTHDQNSSFFEYREAILNTVTTTIGQVTAARYNDPKTGSSRRRYDRVIVLAHSLGSTVAMDALIRLYTIKEQTKGTSADVQDDFASIRALVTFGTSLEKTRYFFDVLRPSFSETALQFTNDQYGVLFTNDVLVLEAENARNLGIYWTNLWYLQDPVANEILSYTSSLKPSDVVFTASELRPTRKTRTICHNQKGWKITLPTPSHLKLPDSICVHGLYLSDNWFWQTAGQMNNGPDSATHDSQHIGILDIVTARPSKAAVVSAPGS